MPAIKWEWKEVDVKCMNCSYTDLLSYFYHLPNVQDAIAYCPKCESHSLEYVNPEGEEVLGKIVKEAIDEEKKKIALDKIINGYSKDELRKL